jgi:hypothetical protein
MVARTQCLLPAQGRTPMVQPLKTNPRAIALFLLSPDGSAK